MGNLYKRPEDYDLKHLRYPDAVQYCSPRSTGSYACANGRYENQWRASFSPRTLKKRLDLKVG